MLAPARPHHQHPHRALLPCPRIVCAAAILHRYAAMIDLRGRRAAARTCPNTPSPSCRLALKRTIEDGFGLVRVRGEISGFKRARLGPLLSRAQGRRGGARRGVLAHDRAAPRGQARGRHGGGLHRPPHHLSRPLEIPARHRHDRAGRHRRAAEAARGAAQEARRRGPVRCRAQAEAAVPAAR